MSRILHPLTDFLHTFFPSDLYQMILMYAQPLVILLLDTGGQPLDLPSLQSFSLFCQYVVCVKNACYNTSYNVETLKQLEQEGRIKVLPKLYSRQVLRSHYGLQLLKLLQTYPAQLDPMDQDCIQTDTFFAIPLVTSLGRVICKQDWREELVSWNQETIYRIDHPGWWPTAQVRLYTLQTLRWAATNYLEDFDEENETENTAESKEKDDTSLEDPTECNISYLQWKTCLEEFTKELDQIKKISRSLMRSGLYQY